MDSLQQPMSTDNQELLYFWAIGDMHYRTIPAWQQVHTQRFAPMFQDLHTLWQEGERPAFCVSPGDLVETCALENFLLARTEIESQLGDIPFYPGIGNHEFYLPAREDPLYTKELFTTIWKKPLRYIWQAGDIVCIMLDYPDPATLQDPAYVFISQETLTFLETTLATYADHPALIFLHCPLHNTVLDRDIERHRDYHSLQNFFAPENSQEIRNILARHNNACLCFSGHTHSGWEAPNLVCTEQLGAHVVTFVNLMSPWYTGRHTGPQLSADHSSITYRTDDPDVLPSFAIRIYRQQARIRVRDHQTQSWLKEWIVPF